MEATMDIADAHRSFGVTVENRTTHTFTRTDMHLQHGIWADEGKSVPPETIKPGKMSDDGLDPTKMSFASESQGVLTGTEGTCDYISDKDGPDGKKVPLHFHWSVPQSGSNTYDPSVGGPLRLETDGGLQGLNIWMGTAIAPQKKG